MITAEERIKAAFGEYQFQLIVLASQLEAANAKIAELQKPKAEEKPAE